MTITTDAPAPPAASRAALWEDFVDILYAPGTVFARREEGRWGWPLLIVTFFTVVIYFGVQAALAPVVQAEVSRALAEVGPLTAEQMDQARRAATTFGALGLAVTLPIGVGLTGLLLWGIGKLVDSRAMLAAAVMIATYAQIPRILQLAINIVQGLVLDVGSMRSLQQVSFSPARFLDPSELSPVLLGTLGRLDLFILWSTVLLAIGLIVLGRVSRGKAYVVAAAVWALGSLPILLGALTRPS